MFAITKQRKGLQSQGLTAQQHVEKNSTKKRQKRDKKETKIAGVSG